MKTFSSKQFFKIATGVSKSVKVLENQKRGGEILVFPGGIYSIEYYTLAVVQ